MAPKKTPNPKLPPVHMPLPFEQAIDGLLAVKPEPKKPLEKKKPRKK